MVTTPLLNKKDKKDSKIDLVKDENELESQHKRLASDLITLSEIDLKWHQRKPAVIALCCLTLFIDMVGYGIVVPILPDFIVGKLHMDANMLGLLFASYALGLFLATPLVSYIADRYHDRKYLMTFGLVGLFGSTLWFASSHTYMDLLIARFIQGISSSASWTTSLALCADVCINDLGKNMGLVFSFNSIGFLMGPFLGGFLYDTYGFSTPFYMLSGLCCFGIIYRLCIDEKPLTDLKLEWIDEQTDRNSQDSVQSTGLLSIISNKRILLGLTIVIITESILAGIEPVLPLFLHDELDASPTQVGLFMILAALPNVLFASKIGEFSESFGELKTIIYGLVAVIITAPFMGLVHSALLNSITIFIFGTSLYVANVPALSYCGKTGTSYGSIYGSFSLAFAFASFIGPTISSLLYAKWGFIAVCLFFSGASGLLAIICLVFLQKQNVLNVHLE